MIKLLKKVIKKSLRFAIRFLTKPFIRKELFIYSSYERLIDIKPEAISRKDTNKFIFNLIKSDKPFMVGRFGWTEIDTLIHYDNFLEMNSFEKLHFQLSPKFCRANGKTRTNQTSCTIISCLFSKS